MSRASALFGACTALGALLILVFAIGTASPSYAGTPIGKLAIDTDITGNVATPCNANGDPALDYPCNNSTVLGSTETCRAIAVGETIQIDVIGDAIPNGGTNGSDESFKGAGQSDMALDWSPSGPTGPIGVTARDITVALIHQGLDDNPAGAFDATTGASSTSGNWGWSDVDVNTDLVGEGGPGIAIRLTIKGLNAGTADLSLATRFLSQATWTDIHGNEYDIGTKTGAQIIVGGGTCGGGGTPTPTPTPSPSPTPTPEGQTPSPSPTPTPEGQTPSPSPTPTPEGETPSPSPTPTPTPTSTPTNSPTPVSTTPQSTNTASPTPTLTPTPTPSGSGTAAAGSGTPTPKTLPPTGGPGGDGGSTALLLALALGAMLMAAAGGSVFAARAKRED